MADKTYSIEELESLHQEFVESFELLSVEKRESLSFEFRYFITYLKSIEAGLLLAYEYNSQHSLSR